MAETRVTKKEGQAPSTRPERDVEAPEQDAFYVPNVDISENNERIRLVAEMPGVDQKSVDVSVENDVLTIEGRSHVDAPEGYELVGREYGVGKYRRDFTLSDAVDVGGVKARVRNGVLEVTLPKREEVRTRKVEIES